MKAQLNNLNAANLTENKLKPENFIQNQNSLESSDSNFTQNKSTENNIKEKDKIDHLRGKCV
jgi:hypothetical protein